MSASVLDVVALVTAALSIVASAVAYVATRRVQLALGTLLDLLLAAGLVRLSNPGVTFRSLLTAATIIAVRKIATYGFRAARADSAAAPE